MWLAQGIRFRTGYHRVVRGGMPHGQFAAVSGSTLINSGAIQLGGGASNLTGGTINSSGTIEALGGTLTLGGVVTNTGLIAASAGNKVLVARGLGSNGGVINLTGGTFDNNNQAMVNLHAASAVRALDAGHHVFLEKPMGLDLVECDAVADAARRNARQVAVNYELRVSRQWGLVREQIGQGALGDVRYQHLSLFRKPFRIGAGGWRYDQARVGSWVLEELVHFVGLVLWYAEGDGMPSRVSAYGGSPDKPLADFQTVVLQWPRGATAVLSQCLGGFEHHTVLEVAGTEGALRTWWSGAMDRTTTPSFDMKLRRGDSDAVSVDIPLSGEVFELEEHLRQTYAGFAEGRSVMSPQQARPSIVVALAVDQALRQGRPVDLT